MKLTEAFKEFSMGPDLNELENHSLFLNMIKEIVDQVNAGGARHAGNILILCNYHHQYLGDRISRQDVIKALKETAINHVVVFKTFLSGTTVEKSIPGKIVTITIPLGIERIKCFFTEGHADYWLRMAPADR